ncbi:MAG: hypothetical protein LBW85_00685 [Deltaproteobacteria bacterium]|jgi:hypothetical protein|nr:hypothetical protein [Deltaproteobacteria bacterium]
MSSLFHKTAVFLFLLFCFAASQASAQNESSTTTALENYSLDFPLFVWNSYAYHSDNSNYDIKTYIFTIDHSLLFKSNITTINNIIFKTNFGDINFKEPLNFQNSQFITGTLVTDKIVTQFNITKVFGIIDGKQIDLTDNFRSPDFTSIPIEILTPSTVGCPTKVLDFQVYEGIYSEFAIGDYQHAIIEFGGQSKVFLFDDNVSYFFENENNINKKVKIYVEKTQTTFSSGEDADNTECINVEVIKKFIEIK